MAVWFGYGGHIVDFDDDIVRRQDLESLHCIDETLSRVDQMMHEAQAQADAIVEQARVDASERIATATREARLLKDEAVRSGLSEASLRWTEYLATHAITSHVSAQRASERLAGLVCLATERVLEVQDRKGLYKLALRTLGHLTRDSKTLVLHVAAEEADHARAIISEITADLRIELPIDIRVDAKLGSGGCVIESDTGIVDASLGVQLDAVKIAISRAAVMALERERAGAAGTEPLNPQTVVPNSGANHEH